MKMRTYYLRADGSIATKRKSETDRTTRAQSLTEARARFNIENAKAVKVARFASNVRSFGTMGSALLGAFGETDLYAILRG